MNLGAAFSLGPGISPWQGTHDDGKFPPLAIDSRHALAYT
jgi:hypothetical protein